MQSPSSHLPVYNLGGTVCNTMCSGSMAGWGWFGNHGLLSSGVGGPQEWKGTWGAREGHFRQSGGGYFHPYVFLSINCYTPLDAMLGTCSMYISDDEHYLSITAYPLLWCNNTATGYVYDINSCTVVLCNFLSCPTVHRPCVSCMRRGMGFQPFPFA